MSANSSTTTLAAYDHAGGAVDILEKIESQRAIGEYSPPSSGTNTRAPSINKLEEGTDSENTHSSQPITHRPTGIKWFLVIFSILVGLFLFALDNTIVADIQPAIVEEFNSVDKIAWLASGFFLSGTALMLPFGQFFQIFNAKWFYILGVMVFEVGSALCGAAPNMNALIVGRVIAGIGATAIYTGSLFLISVNTSDHERYPFLLSSRFQEFGE